MNKFYFQIAAIFFLVFSLSKVFAQDPTFDMTVRNIKTTNTLGNETGDTLTFEIWLRWTNYGASNRFEFAAANYSWSCNRAVLGSLPGLTFVRTTAGTGFNLYMPPLLGQVDSLNAPPGQLYLKLAGNNPNSENPPYIVSADAPFGARIFSARLVNQSGQSFPSVPFNLRFKLGTNPNTFVAYFLPVTEPDTEQAPPQLAVSLMDTVINHYSVENGGFIFPPSTPPNPVANFYANTTTIFAGNSVNFTDSSLNSPTSWNWSFPGGTPSSSTIQNPTGIVYTTPGVYNVSLTAANSSGNNTKTRTNYITVNPNCNTTWKNTLKISDAGNIIDSLKFGTSIDGTNELDACFGEIPLPPAPPPPSFDIRFYHANYESKIDIRKDSAGDKTWILQFQPSPAGYPITFNWNISSFPANEFFYLRDLVGGNTVNINMLNQNSLTLTDINITSLKIEYYNKINKSISLNSGWNILSVPLLKADMKVTSLFPTAASLAYSYNNGYISSDSLKNGKGYWLKFNKDTTYNILGINVNPKNINVTTGWNLIGPFDENIPISSLISVPSGIITSAFYGFSNMYFTTDTLKQGKGYWVRTSASGILMKNLADDPVVLNNVSKDSIHTWTKIAFTDPENNLSELYLANSGQINQNYDLPPVPPEGIMDIRFSSDKNVETYGNTQNIKINYAQRPLKIKVSNLNNHRIRLYDGISGNLFNVILKEGVDVELNQNLDNLILVDEGIIPQDYSLSQNYPNPFNPSTTINYSVPEDGNVRIVIYDLIGREIQTLVNSFVKAGIYEVKFNGQDMSSGMYFYKMQSGKFSEIKRMVLIK